MTEIFQKERTIKIIFGAFFFALACTLVNFSVAIADDSASFENEILEDIYVQLEEMTDKVTDLRDGKNNKEEQDTMDYISKKLVNIQNQINEIKELRGEIARSDNRVFCDSALGPEDYYFQDFVMIGSLDNKPESVVKIQHFLNQYQGANLILTGVHDISTIQAVKIFQILNKEEVLDVWPTEPTGNVYMTTQRAMNVERCDMFGLEVNIPMPNLIPNSWA